MEYPFTLFKGGESKEVKDNGEEAQARKDGYCEPYKFQEYPKVLYKNGLRVLIVGGKESPNEERTVNDKDAEDAARADGFRALHDGPVEPEPIAPDPALAHLPPEVHAAVSAAGKDSVVGAALLAQFPAPAPEPTWPEPEPETADSGTKGTGKRGK